MKSLNTDFGLLARAFEVAVNSNDPSTKVGCVLANRNKYIKAVGWNECVDLDFAVKSREHRLASTIHAEEMACKRLRHVIDRGTIAVSVPCSIPPICSTHSCAALVIRNNVKRIVWPYIDYSEFHDRWEDSLKLSLELFIRNNVELIAVPEVDWIKFGETPNE